MTCVTWILASLVVVLVWVSLYLYTIVRKQGEQIERLNDLMVRVAVERFATYGGDDA